MMPRSQNKKKKQNAFACTQTTPYQVPCPERYYRSSEGAASQDDCALCVSGGYCLSGSTEPDDCPRGFYCVTGKQKEGRCKRELRQSSFLVLRVYNNSIYIPGTWYVHQLCRKPVLFDGLIDGTAVGSSSVRSYVPSEDSFCLGQEASTSPILTLNYLRRSRRTLRQ